MSHLLWSSKGFTSIIYSCSSYVRISKETQQIFETETVIDSNLKLCCRDNLVSCYSALNQFNAFFWISFFLFFPNCTMEPFRTPTQLFKNYTENTNLIFPSSSPFINMVSNNIFKYIIFFLAVEFVGVLVLLPLLSFEILLLFSSLLQCFHMYLLVMTGCCY